MEVCHRKWFIVGPKSPSGLIAKGSSCMLSVKSSPMICSPVSVICDELSVRDVFEPAVRALQVQVFVCCPKIM